MAAPLRGLPWQMLSKHASETMRAVIIDRFGEPDVLHVRNWPAPVPRPGQVLIEVKAAGVNFAEIMSRRSGYLAPEPPFIPGMEVAGTILALGAGVHDLSIGQRVCALTLTGGYAELATADAELVFPIPDRVPWPLAASLPTIVPTAYALLHRLGRVRAGDRVLVTAAAGATGMVIGQLAARTGARTLGVASRPEKAAAAARYGYDHVITVAELQAGAIPAGSVDLALDSVGGAVRFYCWRALAPFGTLIAYGNASGEPEEALAPGHLRARNQAAAGLSINALADSQPHLLSSLAGEAIREAIRDELHIDVSLVVPLARAADAHRAVESRDSTGKVVLSVDSASGA